MTIDRVVAGIFQSNVTKLLVREAHTENYCFSCRI